jgi:hypothetical protein
MRRIFFIASGADDSLLRSSSWSERCRLACRGILVLTISMLALLSATYTYWLILRPQSNQTAIEAFVNDGLCIVLGTCWALITFNMYRFIVSSTGYGDGKQGISWTELKSRLMNLVCAALIGISVSIPVAVALLSAEIKSDLSPTQRKTLDALNLAVDRDYGERLDHLYEAQAHSMKEVRALERKLANRTDIGNLPKRSPKGTYETVEMVAERKDIEVSLGKEKERLDRLRNETHSLRSEVVAKKAQHGAMIVNADSLFSEAESVLDRHFPILILVATFMLVVHVMPILLPIISIKGPYDYQVEAQNGLILARHGIAPRVARIEHRGVEYVMDRFLVAERILEYKRKQLHAAREKHRRGLQEDSEKARLALMARGTA